jgi:hypothetical protein
LLGCWIAIVDCTHVIHKLKHSRYLLLIVPYVMTSYVCERWLMSDVIGMTSFVCEGW